MAACCLMLLVATLALSVQGAPGLIELTNEEFFRSMTKPDVTERLVLVTFCTSWSARCKSLERGIAEVSNHFTRKKMEKEVMIARVTVEGAMERVAREQKVTVFPTVILYGPEFQVPIKYHGYPGDEELISFVEEHLPVLRSKLADREAAKKARKRQ